MIDADDDPIPFSLPPVEGVSSTTLGQRSSLQFLFRPRVSLRSWKTHSVGLRLRLGLQIATGFAGLEDIDLGTVRLASFIPGIEAVFPVGQRTVLRPFIDLGVGGVKDGPSKVIFGTGFHTESVFPWHTFELGFQPGIAYRTAFSKSAEDRAQGDVTVGDLTLYGDARHPLWFKLGSAQPDVGVYVRQTFLWDPLQFTTSEGERVSLTGVFEFGAIFGFQQRPKILFFRLPTVGIGYRVGQVTGFAIRIGGDRMVRLADPPRDR